MYVSAIQGQLTNSTQGIQAKKMPYSVGVTKDLTADSFSSEKTNNVSFTGFNGKFWGGGTGAMVVGGAGYLAAAVLTGGLSLIPTLALTWGGLAAGAAIGGKIGDKIEGPDKDDKDKK